MSSPAQGVSADSIETAHPPRRRTPPRTSWIVAGLVLLFLLAAFLLPLIKIGRYHRTIADSLSRSLGHTVHLGEVNLEIFPLPGLAIHDLVVEEDPSFGAEPLLRAPSVTVFLRLSSLWNQRLEVSRINLDDASVNLVRDSSGRWNFASLLLQASRTASAPTAQRRAGPAPRFPYIEFRSARINFKQGLEKKAFSFLNTDASVWLDNPNQWQIRMEAQPARTDLDLDLADTGTMRLEGSVTRAAALEQLPLDLHAEWSGAELGQVSRLIAGSDSGWRGDLRVEADITGDMSNLQLHSRLRVANMHRLEFTPINLLDVDARCQAVYHHPQQSLDDLTCLLPTGDGHLLLTGSVATIDHPQPSLSLEINHTPVASALSVLSLMRRTLPTNLSATGTINGQFAWNPQPGLNASSLSGHAVADTVSIQLAGLDQPITFPTLTFITPDQVQAPKPRHARAQKHRFGLPSAHGMSAPEREAHMPGQLALSNAKGSVLLLQPAAFAVGAATPMRVSGEFTRSGFSLHFAGDGDLARLEPIVHDVSQLRALGALEPQGVLQADITFAGPWIPDTGTQIIAVSPEPSAAAESIPGSISDSLVQGSAMQGTIHLQHGVIKPTWLAEPIEIATATAEFGSQANQPGGQTITWSNVEASINGIDVKGSASFNSSSFTAPCGDQPACAARVDLDFPTLDAAALQSAILGTGRHGELVQAILSRVESPAPAWPPINGTIHAGVFTIGSLKLNNARAAVSVRGGHLNILSLDAAALGGTTHATGSIASATDGPKYALNISWTGIKLPELATLFNETWGTGSVDGQMNLNLYGYSDLAATATGDFRWLLNGSWTATEIPVSASASKAAPLSTPWAAAGSIANQTLTLTKGPAQGTIAFDRALNLTWATPSQTPLHITGTVPHPVTAEPPPQTVAAKRPRNPRGN